jgi:beta-amylase
VLLNQQPSRPDARTEPQRVGVPGLHNRMEKTMTYINVMAPLVVGDPADPNSEASRRAWSDFRSHLATVKSMGVYAVSTDIWWGLVEKEQGKYDWSYYDLVADAIIEAGLKWIPIISLHRCGGNVGDTSRVDLPDHIWNRLAGKLVNGKVEDVQYVSEQGNASNEFVSCWATHLVLEDYRALFAAFQTHFANRAQHIAEINISLGPAGELRFPSYNSHDDDTGYPHRGALQCYSRLARESWEAWCMKKYGSWENIRSAWGHLEKIEPPVNVDAFFANKVHLFSQYGRDLFDWYQESLFAHGRAILTAAFETFAGDTAPMKGVDIGAKFPGVHWRTGTWVGDQMVLGDRLAELTCGLLRTSGDDWYDESKGHGYGPIVGLFQELQRQQRNGSRMVLHFTCLEMPDGSDTKVQSLAFQLVRWVGNEARRRNVPLKGENALADTLSMSESWHRMRLAIGGPGRVGLYEGLTILRMSDVVSGTARQEMEATIAQANGASTSTVQAA